MTNPSFWSSPWTLGAPQLGFSCAKRRISARISAVDFGLPPRARDRHLQKSRNPFRCQPTTVCGFTTTRTSAQRDQIRRKAVQNSRSSGFNRGRGCFRGEDFQRGVTPTPEEYPDCRQEGYDEFEHVLHLVTLCAQDHRPWSQVLDFSLLQGFDYEQPHKLYFILQIDNRLVPL